MARFAHPNQLCFFLVQTPLGALPPTAVGDAGAPQILPDRLDRGRVLAQDARDNRFLQTRGDRLHRRLEKEEVTHPGDPVGGLEIEHQEVARVAKGVTA